MSLAQLLRFLGRPEPTNQLWRIIPSYSQALLEQLPEQIRRETSPQAIYKNHANWSCPCQLEKLSKMRVFPKAHPCVSGVLVGGIRWG